MKKTNGFCLGTSNGPLAIAVLAFIGLAGIAANDANGWQDPEPSDANRAHEIKVVLKRQADRWNQKDLEGFMSGYWKSDQLTFSGGGSTIRGWRPTLDRYRKKYPPENMGKLSFDHLEVTMLGPEYALVLGQYHLKIGDENADGNFSLVMQHMKDQWKIIHDHSSTAPIE